MTASTLAMVLFHHGRVAVAVAVVAGAGAGSAVPTVVGVTSAGTEPEVVSGGPPSVDDHDAVLPPS